MEESEKEINMWKKYLRVNNDENVPFENKL